MFASIRIFFSPVILLLFSGSVYAQNLSVGSLTDENARTFQLMGKIDPTLSFTVRPLVMGPLISNAQVYKLTDSTGKKIYQQPFYFAGKKAQLTLLPVTLTQQFNTHHPYGWDDGAMIAAKGYQTLVSAGIYASAGPLEIQLRPEFVYAANTPYEFSPQYGDNSGLAYKKIFPGQSSVRLSAGALSAGISTENLWWGPGRQSSLLMSNNAPGFVHLFFGTRRPVKTMIGSFEWQLIGGRLESDDSKPFENTNLQRVGGLYNDWRYLNALVITYHPKWVPGLFLGFNRGLQRYSTDISSTSLGFLRKYLPVINLPIQKKNAVEDDFQRTDQLASFFMRWVLEKAQAEFYLEYGFNDYGVNIRDYLMAPSHSAAYTTGFKKIVGLADKAARLELGFELTQMSESPDYLIRPAGNWYEHSQIRQGYTNDNQIMGAGAGFGANVQTLTAKWVKGFSQLGVIFERVEHDPLNHINNWVDLGIGILPAYKYDNIILSGKFQFINSSQYAWQKDQYRFNLHARLTIEYLF